MDNFLASIILIASGITAISTIGNALLFFGKTSKKGIDKYVENQISPSLKGINDNINAIHSEITTMKKETDHKEMQRLRYECLKFASDIRKGEAKTRQEYEEIFRMESSYEELIDKYEIKNGYMEEEMLYVHKQYRSLSGV